MWSHFCRQEKHVIYTENGAECTWCGEREEDEQIRRKQLMSANDVKREVKEESISNVEVTDMPDGSARVTMDIEPETQTMLMKEGLRYLIDEMKMTDKVVVMEPNEFTKDAKTWDLSDDDYNALFHFGFISALKNGMNKEDEK